MSYQKKIPFRYPMDRNKITIGELETVTYKSNDFTTVNSTFLYNGKPFVIVCPSPATIFGFSQEWMDPSGPKVRANLKKLSYNRHMFSLETYGKNVDEIEDEELKELKRKEDWLYDVITYLHDLAWNQFKTEVAKGKGKSKLPPACIASYKSADNPEEEREDIQKSIFTYPAMKDESGKAIKPYIPDKSKTPRVKVLLKGKGKGVDYKPWSVITGPRKKGSRQTNKINPLEHIWTEDDKKMGKISDVIDPSVYWGQCGATASYTSITRLTLEEAHYSPLKKREMDKHEYLGENPDYEEDSASESEDEDDVSDDGGDDFANPEFDKDPTAELTSQMEDELDTEHTPELKSTPEPEPKKAKKPKTDKKKTTTKKKTTKKKE